MYIYIYIYIYMIGKFDIGHVMNTVQFNKMVTSRDVLSFKDVLKTAQLKTGRSPIETKLNIFGVLIVTMCRRVISPRVSFNELRNNVL